MSNEASKVMFEIYREAGYGRLYRAVFFTELEEHNKEAEIARAMAGEHVYDGFLDERRLAEGKAMVTMILDRLNDGAAVDPEEMSRKLAPFEA